ncbi:MAG: pentapeptide repeat-containing protein [Anaerolineae bacterium]|nr:pentapeptide repeat-containing protein [Anaerolineae bacterium]
MTQTHATETFAQTTKKRWQQIRQALGTGEIGYGLLLILIGALLGRFLLFPGDGGYNTNLYTEALSVTLTILVLNKLADQRSERELKESLLARARSRNNAVAVGAIDEMRAKDWLTGEDSLLVGVNLSYANLEKVDLSKANLCNANLSEVNLCGAYLWGANLSGAELREANLSGAELRYANLSGAELVEADLSGANLGGANLSGAGLQFANLSGANARAANVSIAFLQEANLCGANLSKANLSGAELLRANLSGADSRGANL